MRPGPDAHSDHFKWQMAILLEMANGRIAGALVYFDHDGSHEPTTHVRLKGHRLKCAVAAALGFRPTKYELQLLFPGLTGSKNFDDSSRDDSRDRGKVHGSRGVFSIDGESVELPERGAGRVDGVSREEFIAAVEQRLHECDRDDLRRIFQVKTRLHFCSVHSAAALR